MFQKSRDLTIEFILSQVSEDDIFKKWMGIEPDLDRTYCNPFREDSHPDCKFYISKVTGRLKFHDIAWKWNIDCFNLVQFVENCSFKQSLYKIAEAFNLDLLGGVSQKDTPFIINTPTKQQNLAKIKLRYRVKRADWNRKDIMYWRKFGITEQTLHKFNVAPVDTIFIENLADNTKREVWNSGRELCYVYHFLDTGVEFDYKFYFPSRGKNEARFLQQYGSTAIQGYNQLPDNGEFAIITKSLKDIMSMYEFGLPSIAPQSESIVLNELIIENLSSRFGLVATLFDNDARGKRSTVLYNRKYNTVPLLFAPIDPKDFTDNYVKYGKEYMNDIIQQVKEELL